MVHVLIMILIELLLIAVAYVAIATFVTYAINYSKIAFALFIALSVNDSYPFEAVGGLLSYLIWAAILLAAIVLLCLLPRVNCAFSFGCTLIIAYIIVGLLGGAIISTVCSFFDVEYSGHPLIVELLIKAVCIIIAYGSLRGAISSADINVFSNPIIINIERLLASFVYGVAIFFLITSGIPSLPNFVDYLIFFGSIALSFAVDVMLG